MSISTEFDSEQGHESEVKGGYTPLPWGQLWIVYLIQFSEPLTGTVIYPFVNQFVRNTGITGGDENRTGYFAGIIESAFFVTEAATAIFWGMASDRFGRRPILILGPLGLAISTIGFGMSSSFWYLVAFRGFQGIFNGNIGVSKGAVAELTDKTNNGEAMGFTGVAWSVGVTIAPILGGLLSRPAYRWPDTLGQVPYLRSHPYFLPCFVASLIAFIAFLTALTRFKETLYLAALREQYTKKDAQHVLSVTESTYIVREFDVPNYGAGRSISEQDQCSTLGQAENTLNAARQLSLRMILNRDVIIVLVNHAFLAFCDMSIVVLVPLVWSTSIEHGGLGFSAYTIGWTMGTFGFINAFIQTSFFGRIIRRFGPRKVYIVCFPAFIASLACLPLEVYFSRLAGRADWKVRLVIVVQLTMESVKYCTYGSLLTLITHSAPSTSTLGTINGIAQALGCIMRSLAALVSSSLFAISLQRRWLNGNAVYYLLMVAVAVGIRFAVMLPKKYHFRSH